MGAAPGAISENTELVRWAVAVFIAPLWIRVRVGFVSQPQGGEHNTSEADAEFLQHPAPRDGLGQALGRFIEFVVHDFPFVLDFCIYPLLQEKGRKGCRKSEIFANQEIRPPMTLISANVALTF